MNYPEFVGGSYESQSVTADAEKTVNWYKENLQSPGATSKTALYPTPGVSQLSIALNGPGRAHFAMDGREFAVIATLFVEIDSAGTQTTRGTVALDSNPATISSNGDGGGQLFITAGTNGYVYNLTTNILTQVAALNGKATMGDHLDGYFLVLDANTSTFYVSALLDGTTWATGIDFAQRSAASDPWLAMKVNGIYVWLLGEQTSEVWYDSGDAFPFAKHPSGLMPYGIAATFSVAIADESIIWMSTSRVGGVQLHKAAGFQPENVATYPVQSAFSNYGVKADAVADTYRDLGHTFYLISFLHEDKTWAWDQETNQWAERGTWVPASNAYVAWRPRWHAAAFGEHRMLDSTTGAVYRMSSSLTTDVDMLAIRRLRRAPCLQKENKRIFFPGLELDLEPGLGLVAGQGSDPQVMLRFSNDGGKNWSSELWAGAGKLGEYGTRVRWNRLGSGRRRVFEVVVTDPIPWRITNCYLSPDPVVGGGQGRPQ